MNVNLAPFKDRHFGQELIVFGKSAAESLIDSDILEGAVVFSSGSVLARFEDLDRQPDYVFSFDTNQLMNDADSLYSWAENNPQGIVFLPKEISVTTDSGSSYCQSFDTQDFSCPNVELVSFRSSESVYRTVDYFKNIVAGAAKSEIELLIILDFAVFMGFKKINIAVSGDLSSIYEGVEDGGSVFDRHLDIVGRSLDSEVEIGFFSAQV